MVARMAKKVDRRISWPPAVFVKPHHRVAKWDGEPTQLPLRRWRYDRSLRAQLITECCDCGLQHLTSFELFGYRERRSMSFWLVKRTYRLKDRKGRK